MRKNDTDGCVMDILDADVFMHDGAVDVIEGEGYLQPIIDGDGVRHMYGELHTAKRQILHHETAYLAAVFAPVGTDELGGFPGVFSAIELDTKQHTAWARDRKRLRFPQASQLHAQQALTAVTR